MSSIYYLFWHFAAYGKLINKLKKGLISILSSSGGHGHHKQSPIVWNTLFSGMYTIKDSFDITCTIKSKLWVFELNAFINQ